MEENVLSKLSHMPARNSDKLNAMSIKVKSRWFLLDAFKFVLPSDAISICCILLPVNPDRDYIKAFIIKNNT